MFSTSHPVSAPMNGGLTGGMMDGSGTINPAALNASGMGCYSIASSELGTVSRRSAIALELYALLLAVTPEASYPT